MKKLYIILLLSFGLGQDYLLSFDGEDDYVALYPTFYGYQNEYSIAASFYANSYDGAFIYHNRNHDMGSYLRLTSIPNNGENVFPI